MIVLKCIVNEICTNQPGQSPSLNIPVSSVKLVGLFIESLYFPMVALKHAQNTVGKKHLLKTMFLNLRNVKCVPNLSTWTWGLQRQYFGYQQLIGFMGSAVTFARIFTF